MKTKTKKQKKGQPCTLFDKRDKRTNVKIIIIKKDHQWQSDHHTLSCTILYVKGYNDASR